MKYPSARIVDAVVVTHNSRDVIEPTLLSLVVAASGMNVRVTVVDNLSTDGTPRYVERRCPWVHVTRESTNAGFAAGCNVGIAHGASPYVLLLNPDCELTPSALQDLLKYLEVHPRAAAVGPLQVDERGRALPSFQPYPSVGGEFVRTFQRLAALVGRPRVRYSAPVSGRVDWISGACMLVRRTALETVGPLDEGFFLYFEETDWCRRAHALGLEVHGEPGARVRHVGGTSVARSSVGAGERRAHGIFAASRRRYFRKHHGRFAAVLVEALHGARGGLERVKRALGRGSRA